MLTLMPLAFYIEGKKSMKVVIKRPKSSKLKKRWSIEKKTWKMLQMEMVWNPGQTTCSLVAAEADQGVWKWWHSASKKRQNDYCTLLFIAGQHLALSPQLFSAHDSSTLWVTIAMVMFGCFLAFMISVAEFLLLSHTSSLTLTISGIFKVRWDPWVG